MGEITAVQLQLIDLFAADGGADFRGCSLDLGHALAGHHNFFGDRADGQLHIDADFLCYVQHYAVGGVFLKAFSGYCEVVGGARQTGGDVGAVAVGDGGASQAARGAGDHQFCAYNSGTALVGNRAADRAGVLRACEKWQRQNQRRAQQKPQERRVARLAWVRVSLHFSTSGESLN